MSEILRGRQPTASLYGTEERLAADGTTQQIYGQRGGPYRQVDQRAYDTGYRQGLKDGESDVRRGREYSYSRHDEYRDADRGYRRNEANLDQALRA